MTTAKNLPKPQTDTEPQSEDAQATDRLAPEKAAPGNSTLELQKTEDEGKAWKKPGCGVGDTPLAGK